jgi:hypothetical protein
VFDCSRRGLYEEIVFFISNFNSPGGTERVTATVSNALNSLDFEVHILSIKDENDFFILFSQML